MRTDDTGWSVGLDIGGTKTLAVLLDPTGAPGAQVRLPTERGADAVVDTAATAAADLLARADLGADQLTGIGIGLPGIVDPGTGRVEHAVNLGIAAGVPLADLVSRALDGRLNGRRGSGPVPVRLENDLNAAALGAAHLRGDDDGDLAFLALGTGLAAGLVLDGRLHRGAGGAAGEIGHLIYLPGGRPCPCGQHGCLEQYASGSALRAAWPGPGDRPAPVALFEAAAAGDPAALGVQQDFAEAVATAVRVLLLTTDVAHVVIGGGVSELGAPLLQVVRARLDHAAGTSRFLASMRMAERVDLAPRGVPVGAVGAALVGRKEP
ncbi:ROK family protein [Cellulomonas sp. RIT-PI-Y]|uniref:ROK family protein n=1 Tax=Cellulomonas sp. RIT-PI-Y TaxID=3035297 RepID=UPI003211DC24